MPRRRPPARAARPTKRVRTVWSAMGPVQVRYVKELTWGKQRLRGFYNGQDRVILIDAELNPTVREQTLHHEWVHLLLDDAGIHLKGGMDEPVCDVVATAIVASGMGRHAKRPQKP